VWLHPDRLGEPISFTVNYCAPVADGAFTVQARAARTNRSTQHWVVEVFQDGHTVLTATAVTAVRRETWGVNELSMPPVPSPVNVTVAEMKAPMEWVKRYEMRPVTGGMPEHWNGVDSGSSLSQLWVRDAEARALDFCSLTALADVFFPRIFVRRPVRVPIGTVSMTVYFHCNSEALRQTGTGYLLGRARAQIMYNGFLDQTAQLWNEAGTLLVTSHQILYYKS
jgi:hypothetical protein